MAGVAFMVPGPVRGKGRPRTRIAGAFAVVHTDAKTRSYEGDVKASASHAMNGRPLLVGALVVRMTARFVPPQASKRKVARMLEGAERPTKKPDIDNIAKVMDALNGVVFRDDAQVCSMSIEKIYAPTAGLDVAIYELMAEEVI